MAKAAFVNINGYRYKISSISGYEDRPQNPNSDKHTITLRVYGKEKILWFDTLEEKQATLLYLDKILLSV